MCEFLFGNNCIVSFDLFDLIGWHIAMLLAFICGWAMYVFYMRDPR